MEKNKNENHEHLIALEEQLEINLCTVKEKDAKIQENRLENKNLREKLNFLQDELSTKREEYFKKIEKIEKIQKEKQQVNKVNDSQIIEEMKEKENNDDPFNYAKLTKLVDMYRNTKSHTIVEGVLKDYSLLTSELEKIYINNERQGMTEDVSFIYIKYENVTVPFRIIDEYYTFADLLIESCSYFEFNPDNYRIYDHLDNQINMTLAVRAKMNSFREKTGSIPNLNLVQIAHTSEMPVNLKKDEDSKKFSNRVETGDLLEGIDNVENTIIHKLIKIIFYLVFLSIIFVYNTTNSQIHQSYFMNKVVNRRIVERNYFWDNQLGNENSFMNMRNIDDLKKWGWNSFIEIFDYEKIDKNLTITRILYEYIVVGRIEVYYTKFIQEDTPLEPNIKTQFQKDLFKKFSSFYDLTEKHYTYNGFYQPYSKDKLHYVSIKPKRMEIYSLFSMLNNLNIYTDKLQLFQLVLTAYNYDNNILATISFTVEQDDFGNVKSSYKLCVINYFRNIYFLTQFQFNKYETFLQVGYYILIFTYTIFSLIDIIRDLIHKKLEYFKDFWTIVRIFKITMFTLSLILRFIIYFLTYNQIKFQGPTDENPNVIDTQDICGKIEILKIIEMLMINFSLIFFISYLDENIVGPIFTTINKSLKNFVIFIFSYIFIMVGFGIYCNYFFGTFIDGKC